MFGVVFWFWLWQLFEGFPLFYLGFGRHFSWGLGTSGDFVIGLTYYRRFSWDYFFGMASFGKSRSVHRYVSLFVSLLVFLLLCFLYFLRSPF